MIDVSSEENIKGDRRRSSYHLVFVPKYRRKMFGKPINRAIVREILLAVFQRYDAQVHALELDVDHMHALVELPIKESVWETIRKVKQVSSRTIFKAIPKYRLTLTKGRFWSRYTYYESIGKVTDDKIQTYITEKQNHYSQFQNN